MSLWEETFDQMYMGSTESLSIVISLMLSARVAARKRLFSIEWSKGPQQTLLDSSFSFSEILMKQILTNYYQNLDPEKD